MLKNTSCSLEDLGLVPSTHIRQLTACNSTLEKLTCSSGTCTHNTTQTHTHTHIHRHTIHTYIYITHITYTSTQHTHHNAYTICLYIYTPEIYIPHTYTIHIYTHHTHIHTTYTTHAPYTTFAVSLEFSTRNTGFQPVGRSQPRFQTESMRARWYIHFL